ncbi:MAG: aminotransferase class V-fold PLP-dependent enzyme, partial [Candidatus ainarchaeum sp.]|nr:aminotransferase class V-fold PLP-dependent enzyme [Candidatus ainarchaeum sp.]
EGIQHDDGMIGLGEAAEYLKRLGIHNVEKHERELGKIALDGLSEVKNMMIYGPKDSEKRTGIFTFNVRNVTPHQTAMMLDKMKKIAVRAGVFCAQPGMDFLGACDGAVRASFYVYNTKSEAEIFVQEVKKVVELG